MKNQPEIVNLKEREYERTRFTFLKSRVRYYLAADCASNELGVCFQHIIYASSEFNELHDLSGKANTHSFLTVWH